MSVKQAAYALGHAPEEIVRLTRQGKLLGDLTDQVLRLGGLAAGMRVLDVGCGAGDVALLAAHHVGPAGSVLGIDGATQGLDAARRRAAEAGLGHVAFEVGDLLSPPAGPFDAIIGRLVLMFVPDPISAVRNLASHLRPGGSIIFQERAGVPEVRYEAPAFAWAAELVRATLEATGAQPSLGLRLPAILRAAGLLDVDAMVSQRLSDRADPAVLLWLADTVRTFLPIAERAGVARSGDFAIDGLAERMVAEMIVADGVALSPPLVGAWGHLPS